MASRSTIRELEALGKDDEIGVLPWMLLDEGFAEPQKAIENALLENEGRKVDLVHVSLFV